MREAELLNQTLTAAYRGLRAEMDALEAEKAQEQQYYAEYYYGQAGQGQEQQQSYDAASTSWAAGGGGGYGESDPTLWDDGAWDPDG